MIRAIFVVILVELMLVVSMLVCCVTPARAAELVGDLNGDGKVDGEDLAIAAKAFGSYGPNYVHQGSPAHSRWNPIADAWTDNLINGRDLLTIAENFGKTSS